MTRTVSDEQAVRDDLACLLERAGRGDVAAFMHFYDRTIAVTFRYALAARRGDRASAEVLTEGIYLNAWRTATQHAWSCLSPMAWLISGVQRPC